MCAYFTSCVDMCRKMGENQRKKQLKIQPFFTKIVLFLQIVPIWFLHSVFLQYKCFMAIKLYYKLLICAKPREQNTLFRKKIDKNNGICFNASLRVLTYCFHIIRKKGNVISAKKSKVALTFSYLIFIICRTYIYQR